MVIADSIVLFIGREPSLLGGMIRLDVETYGNTNGKEENHLRFVIWTALD